MTLEEESGSPSGHHECHEMALSLHINNNCWHISVWIKALGLQTNAASMAKKQRHADSDVCTCFGYHADASILNWYLNAKEVSKMQKYNPFPFLLQSLW